MRGSGEGQLVYRLQLKQARTTAKPSDYLSEGLISCTTDFQTTDVKSRADVRAVKRFRRRSEASVTSNPVSVYGILGIMKNTTCSLSTAVIAVAIALTGLASAQTSTDWTLSDSSNGMDAVKTSVATKTSESGSEVLIVRCTGRKLEVYVSTPRAVLDTDAGFERVKFDDGKIQIQAWSAASSLDAAFSPNSKKTLEQLRSSKVFMFEYHPYQKTATTATFHVEGLPIAGCQ